ncbi:Rhodanese-related sulfurtransferase [Pseudorhodobacter antarcticus]|uniref:Rhodanese-related sulfurtransferase n=1 Tax=Pseudorhodobacter antarcticus TaxID=1077947 RepID=A0A1H8JAK9_9RHOB|nr:rhodanese-like domain-containing protein [Pseudorhodobacter antarcticus]SEN77366.1 Rhodanese-related sulfurtransferase [Pseudorhodobacter antarcticus]
MPGWIQILGAVAVIGAILVGFSQVSGRAQAQNVALESPSGAVLVADASMLLVDIRTAQEWQQTGVVEGALLVTYTTPEAFLQAIAPHLKPGQRLGLICRSGNRTSRAARQLAPIVTAQVIDIAGGMNRVLGQGYQPVAPTKAMGCGVC